MTRYRLSPQGDGQPIDLDADDPDAALEAFSHRLGVFLTFVGHGGHNEYGLIVDPSSDPYSSSWSRRVYVSPS